MPKICYFVKVLIFIIHSKTYYCEQIDHERSTILRMSFYTCHFEKMCLCVTSKNFHVNVIKSLSMSTCHMVSIYSMYYLKIIVEIMKKMDYKYCLLYVHCIFRVIKTAIYIQKWIDLLKDVAIICTNNILLYYCILLFEKLRRMTAYIYLMNETVHIISWTVNTSTHKYKNGVTKCKLKKLNFWWERIFANCDQVVTFE